MNRVYCFKTSKYRNIYSVKLVVKQTSQKSGENVFFNTGETEHESGTVSQSGFEENIF